MSASVIILDDLDFCWSKSDIKKVTEMWLAGEKFPDIVETARPYSRKGEGNKSSSYDSRADEVALLLIHLARQGIIKRRKGGVLG